MKWAKVTQNLSKKKCRSKIKIWPKVEIFQIKIETLTKGEISNKNRNLGQKSKL